MQGDIDAVFDGVRKKLWIFFGLGIFSGLLAWAFFSTVFLMLGLGNFIDLGMSRCCNNYHHSSVIVISFQN